MKVSKKLMALITAGSLALTAIPVFAESVDDVYDEDRGGVYAQIAIFEAFTSNELKEISTKACQKYAEVIEGEKGQYETKMQCWAYINNIDFVDVNNPDPLMEAIIRNNDLLIDGQNANLRAMTDLINKIAIDTQLNIRSADISELFDPSILCYEECDERIIHTMFVNYFNAYKCFMKTNSVLEKNEASERLWGQLVNNNTEEGNLRDLSSGARLTAEMSVGNDYMQLLADWMVKNGKNILDQYFEDVTYLIPKDISETPMIHHECLTEFDRVFGRYARLYPIFYTNARNEMNTTLGIQCGGKSK